jgi:ABC-type sugar transport system ATPase subunit
MAATTCNRGISGGNLLAQTVEFRNISKFFPGVHALDSISFTAEKGFVYALMGENGAGKSTFLKILNGDYIPDTGELLIDSEIKHFQRPKDALESGISVIYQERQILPHMTVAENIFLGDWPHSKAGVIDFSLMNRKTEEITSRFGLDIKPEAKAGSLSVAYQQMVEIMKAVRRNAGIIAFDEPTASLSDKEIEILFSIMRKLQDEDHIIFYVSHRMNEVSRIAQKIIVFKDGKLAGTADQDQINADELVRMMVGRSLDDRLTKSFVDRSIGEVVFECHGLTTEEIRDISFSIKKGEILGFAGLVGAGRTEIMRAIFGMDRILSGDILLGGKPLTLKSPKQAIEKGIDLVPEDRKEQGVLPNVSVSANISVAALKRLCKLGVINFEAETEMALRNIEKFKIKTPGIEKLLIQLSGGNQQKTILARCLECNPQILILDEPTKGIDVGAKSEFHRIIFECAGAGMAVIVVSSELPELISLCDRIIIIRDGMISGELERKDFTEERILSFAMPSHEKGQIAQPIQTIPRGEK